MLEIWKDIPNFEGIYQISTFGRVKSLRFGKEKILKPFANKNAPYLALNLFLNKKSHNYRIHILMAITFMGHNPDKFNIVVDHLDNVKTNNYLDNLRLTTNRDNSSKNKVNKTSKYTGVHFHKRTKKWQANIRINGSKKYLGSFNTEDEAMEAYKKQLNLIYYEKV